MTVVRILGSGTLLPDASRSSAAHLVEGEGFRVLLDCGSGTLHGLARHTVAWPGLTHVAVSHYHLDHVGDLSGLLFALKYAFAGRREEPLTLVGPRGFGEFLDRLGSALGDHVLEPRFPLSVVELGMGDVLQHGTSTLRMRAHPTPHTSESVAYRVETPDGAVGYTGDTGPSDALAEFLRGCRVLIGECALTDPPEMALHLAPSGLSRLATLADPELLILTHVYPPMSPAEAAGLVAGHGFGGDIVPGEDGLTVFMGPDGLVVGAPSVEAPTKDV